jgi:hypothetical protein
LGAGDFSARIGDLTGVLIGVIGEGIGEGKIEVEAEMAGEDGGESSARPRSSSMEVGWSGAEGGGEFSRGVSR